MSTPCPYCNSTSSELVISDFRGSNGTQSFVRCLYCDLVHLSPIKTVAEEKNFYDQDLQRKQLKTDFDTYLQKQQDDTTRRGQFCRNLLHPGAHVLDVGAGYGVFVKHMREKMYDAVGVEPGSLRAQTGAEYHNTPIIHGTVETFPKDKVPFGGFDMITLFHVLEHVNADQMLSSIKPLLRPGGYVVIEVPPGSDIMLHSKRYAKFTYQEAHRAYYQKKHLVGYLKRNGYINIQVKFIQRYSFINTLQWLVKGKPQTTSPSLTPKKAIFKVINKPYTFLREDFGISDTIVVVAQA